jgi:hypothetical protein
VFVNSLWYFRGARTTAILYHVHHNQTGFLHLCLRFWWAHRHPALPARSGLAARSRTARGCRLPSVCPHWRLNPPPGIYLSPANDATSCSHVCAAASRLGRFLPPARHDVGELGMASAAPGQVLPRPRDRLGVGCSPADLHHFAAYQAMCAMAERGHAS